VLAGRGESALKSFFRVIGSRFVFAKVKLREAEWRGNALPHREWAFGMPQFDNRQCNHMEGS
jgi:hypothetical protein